MRCGLWLWLLCASAACGADHEWPPPPDNAAASCVYEYREPTLRAQDVSKSTLYLDADDRVFRIDGQEENTSRYHDSDPLNFKATYYMEYDDHGRLVEETGPIAVRVTYDGDYVLVQGPDTSSRRLTLADGHVVHEESTPGWPSTTDLAYDSSGRLASASMAGYDDRLGMVTKLLNYTYDAQNRVVEIEDTSNLGIAGPQPTSTSHFTYTETPSQFVIQWGSETRRFDFDDEGRMIYASVDYGYQKHPPIEESIVSAFTYGDDFIEETSTWNSYDRYGYVTVIRATGRCPMPSVRTAPSPPLPISWSADYVHFDERAASELFPTPQ